MQQQSWHKQRFLLNKRYLINQLERKSPQSVKYVYMYAYLLNYLPKKLINLQNNTQHNIHVLHTGAPVYRMKDTRGYDPPLRTAALEYHLKKEFEKYIAYFEF